MGNVTGRPRPGGAGCMEEWGEVWEATQTCQWAAPIDRPHPNRKLNEGLMTPMVSHSPHLCGQCTGRQPAGMCLQQLISITGPTGILEGAGSLASLRVGVMQIAEFGFNLFADEHPSPEVGGGECTISF